MTSIKQPQEPPMSSETTPDPALMALAAKVEAATGPDRELDAAIAKALGETIIHDPGDDWFILCMGGLGRRAVPAYTASLDAAMMLVPEGFGWDVGMEDKGLGLLGSARVEGFDGWPLGQAATAALSLCAAALRARAAS